jgi:hypothetical protein
MDPVGSPCQNAKTNILLPQTSCLQTWVYLNGGTTSLTPGSSGTWVNAAFNDASWLTGMTPMGFGGAFRGAPNPAAAVGRCPVSTTGLGALIRIQPATALQPRNPATALQPRNPCADMPRRNPIAGDMLYNTILADNSKFSSGLAYYYFRIKLCLTADVLAKVRVCALRVRVRVRVCVEVRDVFACMHASATLGHRRSRRAG